MQYEYGPEGIDDENVMGAVQRSRQQQSQRQGNRMGGRVYQQPPLPMVAAQPHRSKLRSYLGMGFAIWGAADANDKVLTVPPQESFRGERLIIDLSVTSGPSAGLVLLRRVDIGTQPQSPSVAQPAPAAMFSAAATYSRLDLQVAYRAMEIQVTLGITAAPGGTAAVTAAVGFFGEWIR
jgi:hypothetical protein